MTTGNFLPIPVNPKPTSIGSRIYPILLVGAVSLSKLKKENGDL
jgi:hypothetical protein